MPSGIYIRKKPSYWKGKKRPEISGENNPSWNPNKKKCLDCENIIKRANKTTKRCKPCAVAYYVGEKHPRWNGGSTIDSEIIRNSVQYRNWRKEVFKRDNYTCVICGARNKKGYGHIYLNADHIKPFALYPELRLDINNGRTLCYACHLKTDTYGSKMSSIKTMLETLTEEARGLY